ncbi:conserved hypothetical protein [Trichophyton verrucosum HKI 0517]|uniref:Uncharacterized protein n=1 Tax=Trichophyton verrucosum (strain HKI 0517) TaxID=663202 RepID=D4DDF1_TRIVH|nr:uncharacterized protein TRV_05162 [Trichophyton verrucosum HKI 0517]EFE40124.1 conserved hypothetical protein [Trichophyton verrucosum HKI 0517]
MLSSQAKNKILAGAVAIITASGAVWGASLKMSQEEQEKVRKSLDATPEEKINSLLLARENLVAKREMLEKQIKGIEARQAEKAELVRQKEQYQKQQQSTQGYGYQSPNDKQR